MITPNMYPDPAQAYSGVSFVRYDPATGEITGSGSMPRFGFDHAVYVNGERLLEAVGQPETHYLDLATMTVRQKAPNPAVLEGMTLSNLPIPSAVVIEGERYEVTDGTAELAFDQTGRTYEVSVEAVPYLTKVFAVAT